MTDIEHLKALPVPTEEKPMKMLFSACLAGLLCGYDGTTYGEYPWLQKILSSPKVEYVSFCPEDFSFGTPREMCDIHGGTGLDVLRGKAKVLTESGIDWTEGMVHASKKMLQLAQTHQIDLAIMMDISAACGSQVIYSGNRFGANKSYQIGAGVCAAQLIQNGFKVISQRDFASLEIIYSRIDPQHKIDKNALDHHESLWYREYFQP